MKRGLDFGGFGIGVFLEEGDTGHDHASGTKTALESVGVDEGLLDGVELAALFEAFDGCNRFALDSFERGEAGACGDAGDEDRAGTALPFPTAVFGAGKIEFVAQDVEEWSLWIALDGACDAVYG